MIGRGPILALLLALAWGMTQAATPPAKPSLDPRSLSYPPLEINFPKPETVQLDNGLIVYLFVDRELPLIDLFFYMKAGTIYDPEQKAGLSSVAMASLRTGGTRHMTPDEIDETLEFMPARVRFSTGDDMASGSLSAHSDRFPEALKIFSAMLITPRFDPDRLDLAKARMIEGIRRRWDDPGDVAEIHFRSLVYGTESPWARLETEETLSSIEREDLVAFHRRYVRPNNMVMGIAGDFDRTAMKEMLRETFDAWRHAKVTPPRIPSLKATAWPGVHVIDRPLKQTSIAIGHLGANRFDDDKFPLKILSYILGEGGFSSRLMKEIRSTRGLAYSVGGGVGVDSDRGLFQITSSTRAGATVEVIEVVREIIDQLRKEGPTEDEVRRAKEASINSFVFSLEGTAQYMRSYLYYEAYNYPRDFLRTYRDRLAKVTRKKVLRAARKHIHPDRLVILTVGDPESFDRPLSTLGLGDPRTIAVSDGSGGAGR
ncbi:MAG: pitrilysin family protein [Acidobacteria bacterium]|nr:pitrilysin family protein [Acidobacteriota bacterium]